MTPFSRVKWELTKCEFKSYNSNLHSGGGYTNTLARIESVCTFKLGVNCLVNSHLTLENGVMKSPKRRGIISFVFTCLCITKSLLIRIIIIIIIIITIIIIIIIIIIRDKLRHPV